MEEIKRGRNITNSNQKSDLTSADYKFHELSYDSSWIKHKANEMMISYAENAGKYMAENGLTSSKIRGVFGEMKRIQMGFDKEKMSFYLLKPKIAYAYGRDQKNQGLKLFKLIFDRCFNDVEVDNKITFDNFCSFLESIIAYHRAFVKKDY